MGNIRTQDFLLEASRYLGMGYFDMMEDVFVGLKGLQHPQYLYDGLLECVTPKFAEMLNITEDEYYKLLYITGCDEPHCSNTRDVFGIGTAITRFAFVDAIEMAKNNSFYAIKKDYLTVSREVESSPGATRLIDFIGSGTKNWTMTKGETECHACLNNSGNGVEGIMLYLYKHTKPKQRFFKWGPCVGDIYTPQDLSINIWDDETDAYIPVANFISRTEYYSYGELNRAATDLLEKEWDTVTVR